MNVRSADGVDPLVPADGVGTAVGWYRDRPERDVEELERQRLGLAGGSLFDGRLAPTRVVHLRPTVAFDPPSGNTYRYHGPVASADVGAGNAELGAAGVPIDAELRRLPEAAGRAPAAYADEPLGHWIESKGSDDADAS